jgi:hypothetical protein
MKDVQPREGEKPSATIARLYFAACEYAREEGLPVDDEARRSIFSLVLWEIRGSALWEAWADECFDAARQIVDAEDEEAGR